jgi:hypothetical protein
MTLCPLCMSVLVITVGGGDMMINSQSIEASSKTKQQLHNTCGPPHSSTSID